MTDDHDAMDPHLTDGLVRTEERRLFGLAYRMRRQRAVQAHPRGRLTARQPGCC